MKDRFLPPSLPVVYSSTEIEWAKDDKEASYLSLSQNIAHNGSVLPKHAYTKFRKGIPYDYSCPSTKDTHRSRLHVLWPSFWKHQIKAKSLVILPNQGITCSW